jgi:outer membrane protein assembly factor BamB
MNGFEIVVSAERPAPAPRADGPSARVIPLRGVGDAPPPKAKPGRFREAIDVVVSGVNLTARVEPDQAPCVLRDLALALVDLACGVRGRAVVRFYDTPWELGLERLDLDADAAYAKGAAEAQLALSVVRNGADVEVAVHDRKTTLREAIVGTHAAIVAMLAGERSPLAEVLAAELEAARDTLARLQIHPTGCSVEEVVAIVEPEAGLRCAFAAELPMRVSTLPARSAASGTESADLHALLGRGRLRAVVRGRTKELGEVHPFLVAERLLDLGKTVLEAWERGRPLHARVPIGHADLAGAGFAGGPVVGVKLEPTGAMVLTLVSFDPTRESTAFPSLEGPDFVDAIVSYGRGLLRAIVRRDRGQSNNLRVATLRRRVKELNERLREVARPVGPFGEADLVNPHRASYAPYLARPSVEKAVPRAPAAQPAPMRRLKYEARWSAEVPGIDLRATFLCGDRLILSGATQTACVDRADGHTLWRLPTTRATSLPTAGGLARLRGDGRLELRDFGDGSVVWSTACAPRSRGTPAACTVVAPGLPRLLVASDGDRHLVAFDLTSGEPRWRYALTRPGAIRIRRAGRLLVVSSDESQIVAIDALDGHVVWRVRDRLRFAAPAAIEREDLFAVAGEPGGMARLHAIDALSGARRYERPLEASVATEMAPLLSGSMALIVTRDRRGMGLLAIDRASGVERWSAGPGTWPVGTSALALDGLVVLNQPTGETVALSATTGETAWRHVFESPLQGDAPRRLEPVLRSGALFVPQDKVRVLRPSDGAILGIVGSDLVPDMLRVDERCDVYLAEESGHVSAFAASARLGVVEGSAPAPRPRLSIVRG